MSALVTCAGADVLAGRIAMPLRGPWTARLRLDTPAVPSGAASIAADGGLSLSGAVARAGEYLDAVDVLIVGGAGGLQHQVRGAYQSAQLRDPLRAIAAACGEALSNAIAESVLAVRLPLWTLGGSTGAAALDSLATFAAAQLAAPVHWRTLADGTIWIGPETWPALALDETDAVMHRDPATGEVRIDGATPTLYPGVTVSGIGRIGAVEHVIEAHRMRTTAWTTTSA